MYKDLNTIRAKGFALLLITCFLSPVAFAKDYEIGQKNKTFVDINGKKIERLLIKAGDNVHFRNGDPWFHNIFSLSDVKTFDLGSYPQGEERAVTFKKTGEAEIECAIHPQMYMIIEVQG